MTINIPEVKIFYSYSHVDEKFREELEEHLAIFKKTGLIQGWSDRQIPPGKDWSIEIDNNLETADLILLLVSSSFIASDYCYGKELIRAMALSKANSAIVVPIFIRPANWKGTPFEKLQGLPTDAKSVTEWENRDLAWQNISTNLQQHIETIREQKGRLKTSITKTLQEAMTEDIERINSQYNPANPDGIEGIPTGFRELNLMTNGLKEGELIVLASRPSMGKTSLALNIASYVSAIGLPILIFSTKLSAQEIARRMLTATSRINYLSLAAANLTNAELIEMLHGIESLNDKTILINDKPTVSLIEIRDRCLHEKNNLGALPLVIIDSIEYLNLNAGQEMSHESVGRYLKSLARELSTTIIITSQVSRQVETRINKRPMLSDLDNTTGLGEEADLVIFIYLDTHYNPESPDRDMAELLIEKNQYGSRGTIRLFHLPQYGIFHDYGTAK